MSGDLRHQIVRLSVLVPYSLGHLIADKLYECTCLQDHFNNNPDMIDRLLERVVNFDTRVPRYKTTCYKSLHKMLVADFPFTFSVLKSADLRLWLEFDRHTDEPEFPQPTVLFSESVERGYSPYSMHISPSTSRAFRFDAHEERRKREHSQAFSRSKLLQAINTMSMKC